MKTTKKEIMERAHIIAKALNKKVGCYSIAMSFALKAVYKAIRINFDLDKTYYAVLKQAFGAYKIGGDSRRSEFYADTKNGAEKYIKENKANAGVIFEDLGGFCFYVYA